MDSLNITPIITYAKKVGASDIHLTEGKPITLRIHGELTIKNEYGIISGIKMKQILLELLKEDKELLKNFLELKDYDFAYLHSDGTSFRINAFYKLGNISCVLRIIENKALSFEELGLPEGVKVFTELKQGLILVTGPTGSGKSTTMISILNEINKNRGEHILTIEDPVEFIFKDEKSIFSQREVGRDTKGFSNALRSAMREDPDIVMVGEMRDTETVKAAIELAETGHLVISTLHTASAVQTIARLLSFFPISAQNSIRDKLADSLKGVLSQRLIPRKDKEGRVGIYELMFVTAGVKNLIRSGITNQLQGNIETGTKYGMISMIKFAEKLRDKGIVDEENYIKYFKEDAE